ncbi:hypothetical protein CHL76_10940 [Marinococcus halophilus]|uniref:Uncharacterized protein n=1 Tax=Marinococcus halophilus TaxID=1371 RepID=A0A510Y9J2_MARHA|nr:hypothetical protein [Marinococcus halophilus]OZT79897.1 hypothetical protein CHL76_10940 [Marinococcus halophilus]GEK60050.1 hypothetical protein MHA01_29550 [Marinococcus halophilus]
MLGNLTQPTILVILFYIVHAVVLFAAAKAANKRLQSEQHGAVIWIVLISCFLPLLGEVLGLLAWWASKRVDSNKIVSDYTDYVKFQPINLEHLRHEAKDNKNLTPLMEAFTNDNQPDRKSLMLKLINSNISDKGKYLNLGLNNDDSETVHYAATTMNLLVDRYEKSLDTARAEHEHFYSEETLSRLIGIYRGYLDSRLLDDHSQEHLRYVFLQFLEQSAKDFPGHMEVFNQLGYIYLQHGSATQAVNTYMYMLQAFPHKADGYLNLIEYYYNQKDWSGIEQVLTRMHENVDVDKIPENRQYIVRQMGGVVS